MLQKKEFETAQAKTKEAEQASRLAAAESEAALRKLQMAEQTKTEAAAARERHEEVSKKLEDLALKVSTPRPTKLPCDQPVSQQFQSVLSRISLYRREGRVNGTGSGHGALQPIRK